MNSDPLLYEEIPMRLYIGGGGEEINLSLNSRIFFILVPEYTTSLIPFSSAVVIWYGTKS